MMDLTKQWNGLEIMSNRTNKLDPKIEKVLISEQEIKTRITELGEQITRDYKGEEIVVIGILRGAFLFMSDLCRAIDLPQVVDFMAVSSYGHATSSSGIVKIEKDLSESLEGRNLLIIEDIIDSGLTLSYIAKVLKDRNPKSIKICVLCNKPHKQHQKIKVDYCGFVLPDEFVVGYGLDHKGYMRNLPYIGVVKKEFQ